MRYLFSTIGIVGVRFVASSLLVLQGCRNYNIKAMKSDPILVGILVLSVTSCQSPSDPDLRKANDALERMATHSTLAKSCFSVVYPNGKASDFINYLFSDFGELRNGQSLFDEMEAEQMRAIGQTPLPRNVVDFTFEEN